MLHLAAPPHQTLILGIAFATSANMTRAESSSKTQASTSFLTSPRSCVAALTGSNMTLDGALWQDERRTSVTPSLDPLNGMWRGCKWRLAFALLRARAISLIILVAGFEAPRSAFRRLIAFFSASEGRMSPASSNTHCRPLAWQLSHMPSTASLKPVHSD